jgi:hypothetical protein
MTHARAGDLIYDFYEIHSSPAEKLADFACELVALAEKFGGHQQ